MRTLTDNFKKAFPTFSPIFCNNSIEIEEKNNDDNDKFRKLVINGVDSYIFKSNFAKASASFANKSGHKGILLKDCDGLFLCEYKGQKYIVFCELKSTFGSNDIWDANKQLIGTYVRIRSIFQMLQGFNEEEYKILGVIVSFKPTQEQITSISKQINKPDVRFAYRLQHDGYILQQSVQCMECFHPLNVCDFYLRYVPVPNRQTDYVIDFSKLIPNL